MAEWQAVMTADEFEAWRHYYRQQPFDDLHRIHRPAALVAAAMGGQYEQKLKFLAPDPKPAGYSQAELNTLQAFGLRPPPRKT